MTLRSRLHVIGIATVAVLVASPAKAQDGWSTIMREDFSGSELNSAVWRVDQANGQFQLSAGMLQMRSNGSGFPVIRSVPGIVPSAGALRVYIGFQYTRTTCYGSQLGVEANGIVADGCPSGSGYDFPHYGFHRDCARGTSGFAHPVVTGFGTCGVDTWGAIFADAPSYHVGELVFTPAGVQVSVDGSPIAAWDSPVPHPNTIYFGSVGDPCCDYTEYDVDFVEVQVSSATAARSRSWGAMKICYR